MASIDRRRLTNGDLRYDVYFRDPDGNQRSRTFTKLRVAEAFKSTVEADKLRGQWIDPAAGKVLFRTYGDEWLDNRVVDRSTRDQMRSRLEGHVYPVLGRRQLRNIKPSTIQAWLKSIHDLAPRTRDLIFGHVQSILEAAVDDERIAKNPCKARSVQRPQVPAKKVKPWAPATALAVQHNLPDRYELVAVTGSQLGLRQGESFGLSPDDIDRDARNVHVARQVKLVGHRLVFAPPKYGKERDVPVSGSTLAWLDDYSERFPVVAVTLPWKDPDGGELVTVRLYVTTRERKAITRTYFNGGVWKPALRKSGVPTTRENGTHALRHLYASVLLDAGESIKAVSEYLGHADPGFTLRVYTHLMSASADRTRKAIDTAFWTPQAIQQISNKTLEDGEGG